jgi:hypothetical protein
LDADLFATCVAVLPQVWISRAQFEATLYEIDKARQVFQEADAWFKSQPQKDEVDHVFCLMPLLETCRLPSLSL